PSCLRRWSGNIPVLWTACRVARRESKRISQTPHSPSAACWRAGTSPLPRWVWGPFLPVRIIRVRGRRGPMGFRSGYWEWGVCPHLSGSILLSLSLLRHVPGFGQTVGVHHLRQAAAREGRALTRAADTRSRPGWNYDQGWRLGVGGA